MSMKAQREALGLTLEQCALAIGMGENSRGHLSRIESGERFATIKIALKLEALLGGEFSAESVLSPDDAELLAHHRRLSTAQPAEAAA